MKPLSKCWRLAGLQRPKSVDKEILVQLRAWENDALVLGPDLAALLLALDGPSEKRPDFRGSWD
ncbi:hypothetical protein GCM10007874_31800 [Labrys miyagiensis]|uniref:Uncharacterized protein n=1 Tax=Labrys miyagiensis TaxID=346912 RepID=A0ABQ6CII0_9HYPH|nr:hypothetical protein GCM10007874_31800 [Labrys miyagiensis]